MTGKPFENNVKDLRRVCNDYLDVTPPLKRSMRRVDMAADNFRERIERLILRNTPDQDRRMWLKALQYDTNARFVYDYIIKSATESSEQEPPQVTVALSVPKEVRYRVHRKERSRARPIHYTHLQEQFLKAKVRLGHDAARSQHDFNKRFPGSSRNLSAIKSKMSRLRRSS